LVANLTNCNATADSLQCLRELPFAELNDVLNATANEVFYMPAVDGDLIEELGSDQLKKGKFVKVPFLTGTNTDEATGYMFDLPLNTNANFSQFVDDVAHVGLNDTIHAILYPDIPEIGIPSNYGTGNERPSGELLESLGLQYKRGVSFYSDFDMHNNRRAANQAWDKYNITTYSYRFNIIPEGTPAYTSVFHSAEIAFVFNNVDGIGYDVNPFGNVTNKRYAATSKLMTRMWSSFVTHLDPNFHGGKIHCLHLFSRESGR
jgi:carboxylesterase type B